MLKEEVVKKQLEEVIEVVNLPVDIENGRTYSINQPNPNSYTHGYFKYPCKFIPEIPRWVMKKYAGEGNADILDPFSGSGTTLLEAAINGHNAYGTEIDNFAKLLIKVKTTPLDMTEIDYIREWINKLIQQYQESYMDYKNPFVPRISNLYHWFSEKNVQKLGLIKSEISKLENQKIVDFLSVCLASSIRKCSNADDVSPKPYVSNKIEKVASNPFVFFPAVVAKYLSSMKKLSVFAHSNTIGNAELLDGDALNIKTEFKFDIAITSPPYINAFDYARTLRLENLWLELESEETIRSKKREYVGTENIVAKKEQEDLSILDFSEKLKDVYYSIEPIDKKRAIIVKKFFEDMRKNLIEVKNVLVDEGKYCIVIGDSTIRKVIVESWSIICDIAESVGFQLDTYFSYVIQNHYLRIPRGKQGGKINKDYVIVLKKST
ncbi:modification methylase [Anaerobacillus arseniciselenatis]|uniref:site-specific DNA-methyltransferase (cytosine-N(4)-specific) n=1 Tax=Anaerobacillus arseniciselenatis TaxID=85682 RepID=A0A1S2LCF6_9BACI|nr:DNA methyltransferase [Anaerobacillus arseniciselenatis]OIJ09417.1 modification methylase [Anaerobacillus arseniciselenatis]